MGAGRARPGLSWYLCFLRICKELTLPLVLTADTVREMCITAALFYLLLVHPSCSHLVHWTYKGNEK